MARYRISTTLPPAGTRAEPATVVGSAPVDAEIAGSHATVCPLLGCGAGGDDGGIDVDLADNAVRPVNVGPGCSHSLDHGAHADASDVQVVLHTTRVGQPPVTRSIDRSDQDSLVDITTMAGRSMPDHATMRPRSTSLRSVSIAGDRRRR